MTETVAYRPTNSCPRGSRYCTDSAAQSTECPATAGRNDWGPTERMANDAVRADLGSMGAARRRDLGSACVRTATDEATADDAAAAGEPLRVDGVECAEA